jgi:hypothetical protein
VRAPARKPRWLNPVPCTAAKGMYLVGVRKQELPGATLLGNAVDVIWKRNGGEHAWSFLRISRVFDLSSTKRRCPGCIGCEQTAAKRDGGQKNASADTGLSNVDISYDQSSRWQKLAAVPDEIFEREVQVKTHMPTTAGLIRAAAERGHAGAPDHKAPALAQPCAASGWISPGREDARVFIRLGP